MLIYRRVQRLADESDTTVDVGTKSGKYLDMIPGNVIGVDLEFDTILKSDISSYMYADGRKLPFETDSFDYLVMNQVFEHVDGRGPLITEAARVLKPDGTALFSFPNRFAFNRPHGLPRWYSFLPKSIGRYISRYIFSSEKYQYYSTGVFPISPVGARRLLRKHFGDVKYITIDESAESSDIYGNSLAPQVFVFLLSPIRRMSYFRPFAWVFECVWPYVGYECTNPSA